MEKIVIIDGNSLINRAFYATPPLVNAKGEYSNAVYGFTNMLIKIITEKEPTHIAVCFDMRAKTFRHKIYSEYKAGRKGMPDELASQMPIIKTLLQSMNIKCLELEGYEADDIIGTLSKKFESNCYIVTGDRDALQLVDDTTSVWLTKKGISQILDISPSNIVEHFGVEPEKIIDLKALMGDSSDNIPGVAGVGEVTALKLLNEYKDLNGVYDNVDSIKGKLKEKLEKNKDMAFLSYELATIDTKVPIECELDMLTFQFPFTNETREVFWKYNFSSLLSREDIFIKEVIEVNKISSNKIEEVKDSKALDNVVLKAKGEVVSVAFENAFSVFFGDTEYNFITSENFLDEGLASVEIISGIKTIIENSKQTILFDKKELKKAIKFDFDNIEDVALMAYVSGTSGVSTEANLFEKYAILGDNKAYNIMEIYKTLEAEIKEKNIEEIYKIELRVSDILLDMETLGVSVDVEILDALNEEYASLLKTLNDEIIALAGVDFNVNSPKQLATILFENLKLQGGKKTKSGFSTNNEVLESLSEDHEIIPKIIEYRHLNKLRSTYLENVRPMLINGKVHTEYRQYLTTTGRLSSSEPNLQNIPKATVRGKEIRKMFVPSFDNGVLVSADYSQIELRVLAHLSGDIKLVDAFKKGTDIHNVTACHIFGVKESEITSTMRRQAKAINFGIIYGKSEFSLSKELKIPILDARKFISDYFTLYSDVNKYLRGIIESCQNDMYVKTMLNRVRKIPEIRSPNFQVRGHAERASTNLPLQGSAADIMKVAMVKVYDRIKKENLKSKLILQVHDEVIIDTTSDEIDIVKALLIEEMQDAVKLNVPLTVNVNVGNNWYEV